MIEAKLDNDNVIFSNLKEDDLLGSIDFILSMLRFDYRHMHGNCTDDIIKAYKEYFYKESLNKDSMFSFPYIIESDDSIKCKTIKGSGNRGDTVVFQDSGIRYFSAQIPLTVLNEFDTYVIKHLNKCTIKYTLDRSLDYSNNKNIDKLEYNNMLMKYYSKLDEEIHNFDKYFNDFTKHIKKITGYSFKMKEHSRQSIFFEDESGNNNSIFHEDVSFTTVSKLKDKNYWLFSIYAPTIVSEYFDGYFDLYKGFKSDCLLMQKFFCQYMYEGKNISVNMLNDKLNKFKKP